MQLGVVSGDMPLCALASFFSLVTVDNCEGLTLGSGQWPHRI